MRKNKQNETCILEYSHVGMLVCLRTGNSDKNQRKHLSLCLNISLHGCQVLVHLHGPDLLSIWVTE